LIVKPDYILTVVYTAAYVTIDHNILLSRSVVLVWNSPYSSKLLFIYLSLRSFRDKCDNDFLVCCTLRLSSVLFVLLLFIMYALILSAWQPNKNLAA